MSIPIKFNIAADDLTRLFNKKDFLMGRYPKQKIFLEKERNSIQLFYNQVAQEVSFMKNACNGLDRTKEQVKKDRDFYDLEQQKIVAIMSLINIRLPLKYTKAMMSWNPILKPMRKFKRRDDPRADMIATGQEVLCLFRKKMKLSNDPKYAKYKDNLKEEYSMIADFYNSTLDMLEYYDDKVLSKIEQINSLKNEVDFLRGATQIGQELLQQENKEVHTNYIVDYAKNIVSGLKSNCHEKVRDTQGGK